MPEPDTAGSSSEASDFLREEGSDEVMTPSRPRTTEDLFAAIHRYLKLLPFNFDLYESTFLNASSLCLP